MDFNLIQQDNSYVLKKIYLTFKKNVKNGLQETWASLALNNFSLLGNPEQSEI